MTLHGIDVSTFQNHIDWHAVKQAGISFAAIKATEGLGFRDPQFPGNWAGAQAVGMVRGAYHFLRPNLSGADQADFLHAYVRDHGHFAAGDFVMLDLETSDGAGRAAILACAHAFIQRAREQIAKPVFLYTFTSFWRDTLGNPLDALTASCPLWLADYRATPPPTLANWPHGISFWQHSDAGHVPGIGPAVDLDTFFGDMGQLKKLTEPLPVLVAKGPEQPHP